MSTRSAIEGKWSLSRRDLCVGGSQALVAAGLATSAAAESSRGPVSAQEIVSAVSGLCDAELVAGKRDAAVTGIALIPDPSLEALRRAVESRCSLILSPETPYYGRPVDGNAPPGPFAALAESALQALRASPALQAKQSFINQHELTIYRMVAGAAGGRDASAEAMAARLGWSRYRAAGEHPIYRPPGLSVTALVALAHTRLGATGGLRFIGDPARRLRSVLVVPGTAEVVSTIKGLRDADALLTGDLREWEVVTYVHDSVEAGLPKALVATGRILSEQPFLERCGVAVRHAFPQISVHNLMRADPFWRVQA